MAVCDYCGKTVMGVEIFHCKYCGREFCIKHRIPEDHSCTGHPINPHIGGRRDYFKTSYRDIGTSYGHRDFEETHRHRDIIERDSRRKKYQPYRNSTKIPYGIELKHIIFILAFIGFLVFINLKWITNYFQPEEVAKEEKVEQPELPKEAMRLSDKNLLVPIENPTCTEIYAKPDKDQVILSLCNPLCESSNGKFNGQSRCMGDKKLYCKCLLYEIIKITEETYPETEVEEEVIEEEPVSEPSDPNERKSQCEDAFEYVNQLREENGRDNLIWDDKVYNLAVFRSKDMYERNYFDHVTPEGKCAGDFKEEFGITEFGVFAENLGGMTYYVGGDPVPWTNVNEAVEGWMASRGHRYALLYPYSDYKKSAIGCYKYICAFLVLTTEPFQCVHGDEGLEFWKTAEEQPFEV